MSAYRERSLASSSGLFVWPLALLQVPRWRWMLVLTLWALLVLLRTLLLLLRTPWAHLLVLPRAQRVLLLVLP